MTNRVVLIKHQGTYLIDQTLVYVLLGCFIKTYCSKW